MTVVQQVNLYHPIFRKQKKKFSARAMLQAVAVVLAGIALMYGYAWWQLASLRAELAQAEQEYAAALKRLETLGRTLPARQADPQLAQQVRELEARLAAAELWQRLVQAENFGADKGYSRYLAALARQALPGLWLTGIEIEGAGADFTLSGRAIRAELVPNYLQRLASEEALAGLRFHLFRLAEPVGQDGQPSGGPLEFIVKSAPLADPGSQSSGRRPGGES